MLSDTKRFHEYTCPSTTTKKVIDQFQSTVGVDIWSTHFEKMQENLRRLKEINNKLRRDIRQKMGEDLNDLNWDKICSLQEKIIDSLGIVRERKYHVIKTQTDTYRKKEARCEDPKYGIVDSAGEYHSALALVDGGVSSLYAFRLQPRHPNLQDLRLA